MNKYIKRLVEGLFDDDDWDEIDNSNDTGLSQRLTADPALDSIKEILFKGLSYFSEYKYVIEDKKSKNISCYISIQSADNENFILDIVHSSWVELDIFSIISFAQAQLKKRKKDFNLYIKTKKYTQLGEKDEKLFLEHKFECTQNQIVLTNSSARVIKEPVHSGKFTVLSQFYSVRPVSSLEGQRIKWI